MDNSLASRANELWFLQELDDLRCLLATVIDLLQESKLSDPQELFALLNLWSRAAACRSDFFKSFEDFEIKLYDTICSEENMLLWDAIVVLCLMRQSWENLIAIYERLEKENSRVAEAVVMEILIPCAIVDNAAKIGEISEVDGFTNRLTFIWREISKSASNFQASESEFNPIEFSIKRLFVNLECIVWALSKIDHLDVAQRLLELLKESVEGSKFKSRLDKVKIPGVKPSMFELQTSYLSFGTYICPNTSRDILDCAMCTYSP